MAPNDPKGNSTEMVQERRLTRKRVASLDASQPSKVVKESIVEKVSGNPETPALPKVAKVAKPTKDKLKVVVPSGKRTRASMGSQESIVGKVSGDPETAEMPNLVAPSKEATKAAKRVKVPKVAKVVKPTKDKPKVAVPSRRSTRASKGSKEPKILGLGERVMIVIQARQAEPNAVQEQPQNAADPENEEKPIPEIFACVARIIARKKFNGMVMCLCVYVQTTMVTSVGPELQPMVEKCERATGKFMLPSDGSLRKKWTRLMRQDIKDAKALGQKVNVIDNAAEGGDFDVLAIKSILKKSDREDQYELVWAPIWLTAEECDRYIPQVVSTYRRLYRVPVHRNRRIRLADAAN